MHLGTRCRQAARHVEQRLQPGLVVGEVDDDGHVPVRHRQGVGVHPPGVEHVVGPEGAQALDDGVTRDAEAECRGAARQRVEDVVVREARESHREVDDAHEPVGGTVGSEHRDEAVEHRRRPAAHPEGLAHGRGVGVRREHPGPGPCARAHRPRARVLPVEDDPPLRARDAGDDRLHLRQLVDRVDPLHPEVVGRHVGDHRHVVVGHPHAAQQHPPTGRLEDRHLDARGLEHGPRTGRPRVVTLLDRPALDDDPVGRAPPRRQPCRHADVRQEARGRRLPVRAGDRRDRDPRGHDAGRVPRGRGEDGSGVRAHGIRHRPAGEEVGQDRADRGPEGIGPTAVSPDERAHDDGRLVRGAGADTEATRPRLGGHGAGHLLDDPEQEALALLGPRSARLATSQADGGADRPHLLDRGAEVAGQGQGHLDRWAGEVEVRPLEEPDLPGGHRGAGVRGLAAHAGEPSAPCGLCRPSWAGAWAVPPSLALTGQRVGGAPPVRRRPRGSRRRRAASRPSWRGTSPTAGRRRRAPRARGR